VRYLIGPAGLTLGLLFSSAATVWWGLAARSGPQSRVARQARVATKASLIAALLAVFAMLNALVQHDFAVRYVAENGGRAVPTYYTVISLWAALEGSLLLWLLVLTAVTVIAMVRVHPRAGDLHPGRSRSCPVCRRSSSASPCSPGTPSTGSARSPPTARGPTRCCRTTRSWASIRRCSTWATSG
jgi:hypothetical protein